MLKNTYNYFYKKYMKKNILVAIAILSISNCLYSQIPDSIINVDYLSLKYRYLDDNFNIQIDSKTFDKAVKIYKFYPERISKYKDSLGVVLMLEFDDWQKCHVAYNKIGYSWKRLGYHTWQTEKEAEDFAMCFGITHPFRMREFLIDETNNGKIVADFYKELKAKVKAEDNTVSFAGLSREQVLTLAMKKNPVRIKLYLEELYQKRHGKVDEKYIGVGCDEENCCQKKQK